MKNKKYRVLIAWAYFLVLEYFFAWSGGAIGGWLIPAIGGDDVENIVNLISIFSMGMWFLGSLIAFYITYLTFFKNTDATIN